MTTLFLTGATGYVGGQILKELVENHQDVTVTALVREEPVAQRLSDLYPTVKFVVGGLDDASLVEDEAAKASTVINAASNKHMEGAKAIHRGLGKRDSQSYWIQISGASALAVAEVSSPSYDVGLPSSDVYDDLDGIEAIRSLIREHPSRAMDNYILDVAGSAPSIRTALVLPGIIYGKGEGPVNQKSIQVPTLAQLALTRGKAVMAGQGLNRWGNAHVADVARLFTGLANEAIKQQGDATLWGDNGIYLASAGETTFGDISEKIAKSALERGLVQTAEVEALPRAEADKTLPAASVLFGSNARGRGRRATVFFGWKPVEGTLDEEIPRAVEEEASRKPV